MDNKTLKDVNILYGTYIHPFAGYKPKPLKWYQKIWYTIYNAREGIIISIIIAIWVGLLILLGMKGYGKYIPMSVAVGLANGLMFGMMSRSHSNG